jgi:hypothetical protein
MTGIKYFLLFGVCMAMLAGCTASTHLQGQEHSAYRDVMGRQIVPPESVAAVRSGFDGKAAQTTIDRYREQFSKPPPRQVFGIPIGGIR